jgi:predicted GNAT family acetyltransferase
MVRSYPDAGRFLRATRKQLEWQEAANCLMLGICGQLVRHPERFEAQPALKTVTDEDGLVLAAMMTPPHKLVLAYHQGDLGSGTQALAEDLIGESWLVPGVFAPSHVAQMFAKNWGELTGIDLHLERRQRVYELREVQLSVSPPGRLRPADEADLPLVQAWWLLFYEGVFGSVDRAQAEQAARLRLSQRDVFLWEDERPVSMAMKTRPTRHGISITLVYTPPSWRGRGYGTACVAGLSRLLLEAGWHFCSLFADVANPVSNHVYRKIGFRPVIEYDEIAFVTER